MRDHEGVFVDHLFLNIKFTFQIDIVLQCTLAQLAWQSCCSWTRCHADQRVIGNVHISPLTSLFLFFYLLLLSLFFSSFLHRCFSYFLRLRLPGDVVEDGNERCTHDVTTGTFTVYIPKATPGEHFEGSVLMS